MQDRYSIVSENVIIAKARKLDEALGMARQFSGECWPTDIGVQIWKTTGTRTFFVGTVYHDRQIIAQAI